jgi:type II secretory pathway pseudopilin PulG
MNNRTRGFTVIELLIIVAILGAASVLFFIQKNNVEVASRDNQRKTAINAMYYSLEEVYFKAHGYYPATIDETQLHSVDPALFTDPNGVKIGSAGSDYRYESLNCTNDKCKGYTLRSDLQNEADFVKENKNK